jgi:hypothetical protein
MDILKVWERLLRQRSLSSGVKYKFSNTLNFSLFSRSQAAASHRVKESPGQGSGSGNRGAVGKTLPGPVPEES